MLSRFESASLFSCKKQLNPIRSFYPSSLYMFPPSHSPGNVLTIIPLEDRDVLRRFRWVSSDFSFNEQRGKSVSLEMALFSSFIQLCSFFPFCRMVFSYLVTKGYIFDISLCENSINQFLKVLRGAVELISGGKKLHCFKKRIRVRCVSNKNLK